MALEQRLDLFKQIESHRNRPLVTYVTSIRPFSSAQIASDVIPVIIEQISQIPTDCKEIDFLIVSNGGDPIASSRIISILRERFSKIHVLVPFVAYSAATILALGADDIFMHPYSNLGPVDPQLNFIKKDNGQTTNLHFSSEDLRNFIEFVKDDIGVTDQEQLMIAFNALSNEVGSLNIGSAKRSQQLMMTLSERMLETHMADHNKASNISLQLNSSYYHHGYAVSRSEAKKIGLNIKEPDKTLESLLWKIWMDYAEEMKCFNEFNLQSEVLSNPDIKNKLMSFTPQVPGQPMRPVETYSLVISNSMASIESLRCHFSVINTHNVVCWREINGNISINDAISSKGWEKNE